MTPYYRSALARIPFASVVLAGAIVALACAPRNCSDVAGSKCSGTVADYPPARVSPQQGVLVNGDPAFWPNRLTPEEQRDGWQLLFDGKTFNGWRGLGYDTVPTAHWKIENGVIRKLADGQVPRLPDGQPAAGGDLMTRETFRDFELKWEWKISRAGNSGVKYNVSEEISMANAPNHAALGFEYQMLDDSLHEDNKVPSHRAGALYDLIPPNANKVLAPVGEWNDSRIVFRGNHGEHWLNGKKVVEFELGTPVMDSLLAKSKYRDIKGFADKRAGHIVLQDHVDEVFFRNIKIRRL
ncbi:MAG TPA: DUF1080 domain-containing protein [Gemmatimonadaceae bacterium]